MYFLKRNNSEEEKNNCTKLKIKVTFKNKLVTFIKL